MSLLPESRPWLTATLLRSFTIQGSWNYRTMIGNGFAFALLPVLRHLYASEEDALQRAVERHAEHFNAHPYMADLALGAVARMEADGADPETVRRFKAAIRGPLGGLGDALVWAGWLPTTLMIGLILTWLGVPALVAVLTFLVVYNAGHLGLRLWAFRAGYESGRDVGRRLKAAGLSRAVENVARIGSILLGILAGLVLVVDPGLGTSRWTWTIFATAAFAVGWAGGQRVWRPAALAVVGAVVAITLTRLV